MILAYFIFKFLYNAEVLQLIFSQDSESLKTQKVSRLLLDYFHIVSDINYSHPYPNLFFKMHFKALHC